jgi:hypothetical protein
MKCTVRRLPGKSCQKKFDSSDKPYKAHAIAEGFYLLPFEIATSNLEKEDRKLTSQNSKKSDVPTYVYKGSLSQNKTLMVP